MLQTINRHQPLFTHLSATPQVHPEELFERLLQLTGDLAVFSPGGRRPRFQVQYRQDDLRASFAPVVAELRSLLSARPEAAAVQIDLIEKRFGVRVAVIADLELLQAGTLVLAANAQIPPEALRARFPTQVKAGPSDKIRDLVNLQLPGIALQPLQVAPRQVPFHAGFTYFELDRGSDLYRALQKSGSLALHVAGEFPGLEMALWAIRS
jgi:type VI secretion system protein ImpJ